MKNIKLLGLAAVAVMALMAFAAGSAFATELYNGGTTLKAGTVLHFTLKSGASANLVNTAGETLDTCTGSTVKGEITSAGSSTSTTTSKDASAPLSGCTFPTTTTKLGGTEFHSDITGPNGTMTSTEEVAVTVNTIFFGSCIYGVSAGTSLGTVTGGTPATAHANAVAQKKTGSNLACPETAKFTATYVITSPASVEVKPS